MKILPLFFSLLFCTAFSAHCQIEKGDILVNFNSGVNWSKYRSFNESTPNTRIEVNAKFGIAVTDHFLVGSGFNFQRFKGVGDFSFDFFNRSFLISPYVRYYIFEKRKLQPYLFINSSFGKFINEYSFDVYNKNEGEIAAATTGFGANLFIAKNISLEFEVGTSLFESKFSNGLNNTLFANFGLQTFINSPINKVLNIESRYLQKGNFILSSSGDFTLSYNRNREFGGLAGHKASLQQKSFQFLPGATYFIADRVNISAGAAIYEIAAGNFKYFNYGLHSGLETYLKLGNSFYLVPALKIGAQRRTNKSLTVRPDFRPNGAIFFDTVFTKSHEVNFNTDLSISLKHFTQKAGIWSFGADYNGQYFSEGFNRNDKRIESQWRLFAEAEYFFTDNISASVKTYLNRVFDDRYEGFIFDLSEDVRIKEKSIELRIKYFIFSRN